MARQLAELFTAQMQPGLETAYGTVTSTTPLRVQLDAMETGDIGPLAFVRNRPQLDERVLLLRNHGQKDWLVTGVSGSGDVILAWDEAVGPGLSRRVFYSVRRGGIWLPAVMYGGESVRSTPIISSVADAGPVSSGAISSIQETLMTSELNVPMNMLPRYFVMSDGAALVLVNSQVGGVLRFRVHKKDPVSGSWANPITAAFAFTAPTYCIQSGDTIFALLTAVGTSYVEMWRIDYAGGVPAQAVAIVDAGGGSGDRRTGFYYDATNGLLHVSWVSGTTTRLSAYDAATLAHVYTEDVPLAVEAETSFSPARIGGDGGASFVLVTTDNVSPFAAPRVVAVTASGSGYSYVDETASVPQSTSGWSETTVFHDGQTLNLLDGSGQVIVRLGPNSYSELVETPLFGSTPIFYANVGRAGPGAQTRVIYNTAAASFPGAYEDNVIVLP